MNAVLLIGLTALLVFALGVLVGSGQVTSAQDARDRRQAARQRELNVWTRGLRHVAERQARRSER